MTRTITTADAAGYYAGRGLKVFPLQWVEDGECGCGHRDCSSKGKHPITANGCKDATTNMDQIAEWWRAYPKANVGIATGADSGVAVVDIDNPEQFIRFTEIHGKLPTTLMSRTGKGFHLFFRHAPGVRNKAGVWPGIDIRGEGGYVVAPPSVHVSGRRYQWQDDDPGAAIAPFPPKLLEMLEKPERKPIVLPALQTEGTPYGLKAMREEIADLRTAEQGTRNDRLNETAFKLYRLVAGGQLSDSTATSELTFTARGLGLMDREIDSTLKSAREAGMKEPKVPQSSALNGHGDLSTKRTQSTKPLYERGSVPFVGSVEQPPVSENWSQPIPLGYQADPSPFPLEALRGPHRAFVEGVSNHLQTPYDLAALISFSAVAVCTGGKVRIRIRRGWEEPTNLYSVVVMPPGERKTAAVNECIRPLMELEKAIQESAVPAILEADTRKKIAEEARDHASRRAGKTEDRLERMAQEADVIALAIEAEQIEVPTKPRLLADDATPEKVTSLMAENAGRIGFISAEGGIFDIMAGRYSGSPNLTIYLKGHSGDPHLTDRVGRAAESIPQPAMTLGLAVQPRVLASIGEKDFFRGLGLAARPVYAIPRSKVGERKIPAPELSEETVTIFHNLVKALGKELHAQQETTVIQLSPGAAQLIEAFEKQLEPRLGMGGDLSAVADWAGKLSGAVARIAALLHIIEGGSYRDGAEVAADTMERAVSLGHYFIDHARRAFDLMDADPLVAKGRAVLDYLRRKNIAEFKRSELHNGMQGSFKRARDLEPVLSLLFEQGWIRPLPQEAPGEKGGRPPSPKFQVNPSLQNVRDLQNRVSV